jgi:Bacterial dipeptidyl-peptidase Sh3 domain
MRCGVEAAPLRAEPREDAEQVTQALRGDLLKVGERQDGWARVTTPYGYRAGFARTPSVARIRSRSRARSSARRMSGVG